MRIVRNKIKLLLLVLAFFVAISACAVFIPNARAADVLPVPGTVGDDYIESSLSQIPHSTPSTGKVKILFVMVEFLDVSYAENIMSDSEVKETLFGGEDSTHEAYPFESTAAYYRRASFGRLRLDGDVVAYTARQDISYYENYRSDRSNYELLLLEVMHALNATINFADYDSDDNGVIDGLVLNVPSGGDDVFWHSCTATFWYNRGMVWDGVTLNHYIISNAQPLKSILGHRSFNQVISHELGHSLGLPDYYKYNTEDWEGMNGEAGHELMDDMEGDLSAFSKLMLGWLRTSQVKIFNSTTTSAQNFSLAPINEPNGNCMIIFRGGSTESFLTEFFICEYVTPTRNNHGVFAEGGIRIIHVQAETGTNRYEQGKMEFSYSNYGSLFDPESGVRLLKLVNDGNGFFNNGDMLTYGTENFGFYTEVNGQLDDPCIEISFGASGTSALLTAQRLEEIYYACYDSDRTTLLNEGFCYQNKPLLLADAPDKKDERYVYEFSSWNGYEEGMLAAETDMSFVAEYVRRDRLYSYTFFDDDGRTVLSEGSGVFGSTIAAPKVSDKLDPGNIYTFVRFEGFAEGQTLTQNLQFKAVYETGARTYTYTFWSKNKKKILKQVTDVYGATIFAPRGDISYKGFQQGMKLTQNVEFVANGLEPETYVIFGAGVAVLFVSVVMTGVFLLMRYKRLAKSRKDRREKDKD